MTRQAAFEQTANRMLKGNLHAHSTRSDGSMTPDAVIRAYAERGYDFLALTDHRAYNYTDYAPEAGVIIVPGMEMDRDLPKPGKACRHCFHTVCVGPARGNGFLQDERYEKDVVADQAEYQAKMLDMIHEKNNLTIHCHPGWSGTPAREFEKLRGNFAIEVWNSVCALGYDLDTDALYWDELLRQGLRVYGVASDDCHGPAHIGHGWINVNAARDLDSILSALKNGAFYASCGPEIHDFYVEDGVAHLACGPVDRIRFNMDYTPTKICRSEDGTPITHAEIAVDDYYTYIRASVVDADGRKAWTNPIFLR